MSRWRVIAGLDDEACHYIDMTQVMSHLNKTVETCYDSSSRHVCYHLDDSDSIYKTCSHLLTRVYTISCAMPRHRDVMRHLNLYVMWWDLYVMWWDILYVMWWGISSSMLYAACRHTLRASSFFRISRNPGPGKLSISQKSFEMNMLYAACRHTSHRMTTCLITSRRMTPCLITSRRITTWFDAWRHASFAWHFSWEVGRWGRDPFSRNLMSPTPRRKWYLTTGRRFH